MASDPPPPDPGSERGRDGRDKADEAEAMQSRARLSGDRSERPRRPRYLAVALVAALVLGAGCWSEGCDRMRLYKTPAFYNGETDAGQVLHSSIKSDDDRRRAEALYQHFIETAELARKRAFPMAAATWVLGAALLVLASRGLSGRNNTRNALMQVLLAQAVVVAATYLLTPDLRNAELDWEFALTLIHQRETLAPDQYEQAVLITQSARNFGVPGWVVARSVLSLLIVFALTRPRARAFFEAAGTQISQG